MIIVEQTDPHHPQATALLRQSHALMESLFPPEDNYFLDIDELCADHITFFAARMGADILGTGALANKGTYGEIKSMFVAESARGNGIADALMRQLEDAARDAGLKMLKLETGNVLHAAHKLYRRHGFQDCGVFGDYVEAKSSIFMEKAL